MINYEGKSAILATKHNKERVMAPILEKELGLKIFTPQDYDTDQFGTFTREITRAGNQLEAAQLKAKTAMDYYGYTIGISSEGAFGSHPDVPWIPSNLELVLFIDYENNLEVRGHHRSSSTNAQSQLVKNFEEAKKFAEQIGFPEHGLIVRRGRDSHKDIYKGIQTYDELEKVCAQLLKKWFVKEIYLETDLRAHMNPTRMENIKLATDDLVASIKRLCPQCGSPGFATIGLERGLPCELCTRPTYLPLVHIYECQKCKYRSEEKNPKVNTAYSGMCDHCNP